MASIRYRRGDQRSPAPESHRERAVRHSRGDLGFNFGAFFLTPLWLLFHGRVGTGLFLIALNVLLRAVADLAGLAGLLASLLVSFGVMLYFGATGNQIAARRRSFSSVEELKRSEKPWNVAGLIVGVLIIIPLFLLGLAGACRML